MEKNLKKIHVVHFVKQKLEHPWKETCTTLSGSLFTFQLSAISSRINNDVRVKNNNNAVAKKKKLKYVNKIK